MTTLLENYSKKRSLLRKDYILLHYLHFYFHYSCNQMSQNLKSPASHRTRVSVWALTYQKESSAKERKMGRRQHQEHFTLRKQMY